MRTVCGFPVPLRFLSLAVLIVLGATARAGEESSAADPAAYDAELAAELGADDYGMRRYVMAFLKSGPNRPDDSEKARALQQAHMENIRRMAKAGQLVLAGPFMDDGEIRGIYVFAVDSVEEGRRLTATDPAIQAGSLVMELHPWYGSAALMKVNDIHARIEKDSP